MIRSVRTPADVEVFTSSVRPDLSTEVASLAGAVEWGDAHPVAYKIVTGTKSAVFGKNGCTYLGFHRNKDDPESVLHRVDHLRQQTLEPGIFGWRARFTLEHYGERGFHGDLFRLWDGEYHRSALYLDYTGATIEEVLDQFTAWCDPYYKKVEVHVGDRVGRRFAGSTKPSAIAEEIDPFS